MRRFWLPLVWAASTSFSCSTSFAQPPAAEAPPARALTLPQAQAAAAAQHPELDAARREVEAADAGQMQAGARPNPTLSAELEGTRRATRTTTVLLNQPIELGGKRAARLAAAERARDVALAELAARQAAVRAGVATAFFDTLIAQERVRLADAAVQLSQRDRQVVGHRVQAGKVSPIDETRAGVVEAGVQLELLRARSEWLTARQRLGAALGRSAESIDAVDAGDASAMALPATDAAPLAQRLQQAPAVRRAEADAAHADALADIERTRRTSDVTLSVGTKRDGETQRQMAVIGVSVPLPLFDTNQGAVLQAQRRADKARAELQAERLRLELDARVAAEQLRAAKAEATLLQRDLLPGAQQAYDATVTGYQLGKFGLTDVLDAQRSLLQAKTQHVQAYAAAHRAAAELDRLLGATPGPTDTGAAP